jgi:hypothetical protein
MSRIVTYAHRYKQPPRKKSKAATITGPAIVRSRVFKPATRPANDDRKPAIVSPCGGGAAPDTSELAIVRARPKDRRAAGWLRIRIKSGHKGTGSMKRARFGDLTDHAAACPPVIETEPAGGWHTRYFFRPHRFRSSLITAAVLWTARMVLCWDTSRRRRSRTTTGPPISAVVTPASARRRMRCVSRSVPLRKSAATGDGNGRRRHARHAGEYGRAIFDTWMRRQLIDIWRNRRQQRLRRRPRIWQVGRPATVVCATVASATRAATVVLRLRVPNDLPSPVCSWCFCGMLKAVAWH